MAEPCTTYATRADSTLETELDALTSLYSLAIRRYEENAAGMTSTDGDDTKGRSVDDFRADEASVPR